MKTSHGQPGCLPFDGAVHGEAGVLLLINGMDIGGAEMDVFTLAKELKAGGYRVAIASAPGALCPAVRAAGVPHYSLRLDSHSPLHMWQSASGLHRVIDRGQFSVLNSQSLMTTLLSGWALSRWFPIPGPKITGARLVATVHNIHNRHTLRFAAWLLRAVPDAVLVESAYEMAQLRAAGLPAPVGFLLAAGIAPPGKPAASRFQTSAAAMLGTTPVIATVARLSPEKGIDLLLSAFVHVARRLPKARLLVVGDGPERRKLESLTDQLGIRPSVNFLGTRDDVMDLLQTIDIYALTSLREAQPRAVREAMMCGKPVVALDVGGVSEAVQDGVNGILVRERDPGLFAQAILRLATDEPLARRMGQEGCRMARERFGIDRWVNETVRVYRRS